MLPQRTGKLTAPRPRLAAQPPSTARRTAPNFARAVGSFVPTLTRKAFERFGFSTASLVTDWRTIAGSEFADRALPERIKWPRLNNGGDTAAGDDERPGATLVLRVDPAHALAVEYGASRLLERINTYFGYRAVVALRLVQAPIEVAVDQPAAPNRPTAPASAKTSEADGGLAAALARLEAGVRASRAAGSVTKS